MGTKILALLELEENLLQVVISLAQAGFDVIPCSSFTEAMEILAKEPNIEMIISDVHLQNGSTVFDFVRWIKKNGYNRNISLVLFSFRPTVMAKSLEGGVRISARLLGVARYITMENFDADLFRKKIEAVLAERRERLACSECIDRQFAAEIKLRQVVPEWQKLQ